MSENDFNPEEEFTVGEKYGNQHPKNQLPRDDAMSFTVRGVDPETNTLAVEFIYVDGHRVKESETEELPLDEYQEFLHEGDLMHLR